jgi:non-ribosomal peptide synthetase component F
MGRWPWHTNIPIRIVHVRYDSTSPCPLNASLTLLTDVSVADIFFSIMRGACVCIPSEDDRINDPAAAAFKMGTTWANLTPSVANIIHPDQVPTLRTLVLGGEAPTRANIQRWGESVDLILCTGPAETTIHLMGSDPVIQTSTPNEIGRAVGGRVWVVDPTNHDRLAPIGCVGEMHIEGRIVSREYLNMPEKTASRYARSSRGCLGTKVSGTLAEYSSPEISSSKKPMVRSSSLDERTTR